MYYPGFFYQFHGNDLTFFEDKTGLMQIEFDTSIPWGIDKSLEGIS
jgi:hypothetical protein